jgi:hypothetical protein
MYAITDGSTVTELLNDGVNYRFAERVFQPPETLSAEQASSFGVLPFSNITPALEWNEKHNGSTDVISATKVIRTQTVVPLDATELIQLATDTLAQKKEEVRDIGREKRDVIVDYASPYEAASWSLKKAEADAYNLDPATASTPILSGESAVRGISLADIVARVTANASAFSAAEANISGSEGKHNDALDALTTTPDLLAYDVTIGWVI